MSDRRFPSGTDGARSAVNAALGALPPPAPDESREERLTLEQQRLGHRVAELEPNPPDGDESQGTLRPPKVTAMDLPTPFSLTARRENEGQSKRKPVDGHGSRHERLHSVVRCFLNERPTPPVEGLRRVLEWDGGLCKLQKTHVAEDQGTSQSVNAVLLEASQLQDEARKPFRPKTAST